MDKAFRDISANQLTNNLQLEDADRVVSERYVILSESAISSLRVPRAHFEYHDVDHSGRTHAFQGSVYLSLIIPTYDEGDNIEKLIHVLSSLLDRALPNNYELIVVDDDSPDRTWEVARALSQQYTQLRVVHRQKERGLSTAVVRGWQFARGEILGVIDGDLQHPPEVLLSLLSACENGADLAVASRHIDEGGVDDWHVIRRILSRGAQVLGLLILPKVVGRVSDPMSGYFMVRRSRISEKPLNPLGYKILIEVLGRGDIQTIAEVGYVFREREKGESKVTLGHYSDYIQHLIRLRVSTNRAMRHQKRLNFPIMRFIRFALVGLSGVVVDMLLLYFFYDVIDLRLTRSAILASEIAIINNFLWNDQWTFGDLAKHQRERKKVLKRFFKFNVICLMGLVIKILVLNILFNGLHMNAYLANFLAIGIATGWNFWINLKLNWRTTEMD